MLRVSKLTDYGTVILARMALSPAVTFSTASLASQVNLPISTVSKLLKIMSRSGLLDSSRGKQGGYKLAKSPLDISLAEVIEVLEGPIGLTQCSHHSGLCQIESSCAIRQQWHGVNGMIHKALQQISLAALLQPTQSTVHIGLQAIQEPSDNKESITLTEHSI